MEDLPNGFTGFSRRGPDFESASEALRKAEIARQSIDFSDRKREQRIAQEASRAARSGWQADLGGLPRLDQMGSLWGGRPSVGGAQDVSRFVNSVEYNGILDKRFDLEKITAIPEKDRRWAWVEIDRSAIQNNMAEARRACTPGTKIMAVVKADGYGHGAVQVARTAMNSGAEYLGVATIDEGIELREALINAPILVLSEPPATTIPLLLAYKLMPSVYTPEFAVRYAEAADLVDQRAPYHLAVNTGMNRIGVRHDEAVAFMKQIGFHRALDLKGVFTHFATADSPEVFDFEMQLRRFTDVVNNLRAAGVDPGLVHAANSAALFRYPEAHFDMVRLGIALYGYHPCPETRRTVELKPAMSVHARVTDVKTVPMSEGVSYGLNYRSPGSVRICTVPLGYADGLCRGLSGRIDFLVDGVAFRQVGDICMDQCMFEVDLRTYNNRRGVNPQVGDEVVIVGEQGGIAVTVDELADLMGTIPYEIVLGFAQRLPRLYK